MDCAGDGSGVGDSAVPKGGGMSVLAGWLGRPWASGVFSPVLSQGGRGWAELLSDVEKSSLCPPASSSLPLHLRCRHIKSYFVCNVLPPRQVIGAGTFFFFSISAD